MITRKLLYLLLISFLMLSCGEEAAEQNLDMSLEDRVNLMIEQNEYDAALDMLADEDTSDPAVQRLREKTHLNYGLHSMNTFDQTEMRTRMNNALAQFTEVLRINPQNNMAREYAQQILDIYATIPDRSPDEDVVEGLRDVGFDI